MTTRIRWILGGIATPPGRIEAVLAGYQTGDSMVAAALLAQRELLDLQLALFGAQADGAMAWTQLEGLVGRAVEAKEVSLE